MSFKAFQSSDLYRTKLRLSLPVYLFYNRGGLTPIIGLRKEKRKKTPERFAYSDKDH